MVKSPASQTAGLVFEIFKRSIQFGFITQPYRLIRLALGGIQVDCLPSSATTFRISAIGTICIVQVLKNKKRREFIIIYSKLRMNSARKIQKNNLIFALYFRKKYWFLSFRRISQGRHPGRQRGNHQLAVLHARSRNSTIIYLSSPFRSLLLSQLLLLLFIYLVYWFLWPSIYHWKINKTDRARASERARERVCEWEWEGLLAWIFMRGLYCYNRCSYSTRRSKKQYREKNISAQPSRELNFV